MKTVDVGAVLAQGLAAHQAGRLTEAECRYRRALKSQPNHPDALHLLGVVALQSGKLDSATASVRKALTVAPAQPTFWNTLGIAQRAAGQLTEALGSFGRAVELAPAYANAWRNLGDTQQQLGSYVDAAVALEQVTALQPSHAQVWNQRGTLAYVLDQPEAACEHLGNAVALDPGNAEYWSNLGVMQLKLGRLADAEVSLRRSLALQPGSLSALNNLGSVLIADSRYDEALPLLQAAVTRAPNDPSGWLNLGHALKGQERFQEALISYDRVLTLAPNLPPGLIGRGDALQGLGDCQAAITCYEQAKLGMPNDPILYEHLGVAYQRIGQHDAAIVALRRGIELDPTCDRLHSGLIFALDLHEGQADAAWEQRLVWNASIRERLGSERQPHTNRRDPDRPLRIGYVSADFREHSAGTLALPVLRTHDRTQVRVYCYSGVAKPDHLTERFKTYADVWHDTARLSDDELAALIRADEIDVLMDLSGHTGGNRLAVFAREPAPVQATAWGYATGTGLDSMHYFLADEIVVPPAARSLYVETVVNLPSVVCYEAPDFAPPVAPSPAATRGYVAFGAFNRLTKITPEAVHAWGRVLLAVPDARLIVKSAGLEEGTDRQLLLARLAEQGISQERVTMLGATPQGEHLAAHADVDLLLDTFPHTGGITTLDGLHMGVPTVALLGERVAGRLSASFLTMLGLGELVAETVDEYVAIAQRTASRLGWLSEQRASLRERLLASPISDAPTYTRAVEAAYRTMWYRWCEQQSNRSRTT